MHWLGRCHANLYVRLVWGQKELSSLDTQSLPPRRSHNAHTAKMAACRQNPSTRLSGIVIGGPSLRIQTNRRKADRSKQNRNLRLPERLQRSRRVGASPPYWFIIPFWAALGTGIVRVMGWWNFRLRGSTVTMGLTATRLPSSLATSSGDMAWAWLCRTQTKTRTLSNHTYSPIHEEGWTMVLHLPPN